MVHPDRDIMNKNSQKKLHRTHYNARKTIIILSFCLMLSFITIACADDLVVDLQAQEGGVVTNIQYPDANTVDSTATDNTLSTGDEAFYELVLDSEEKIGDAYIAIKEASSTKDWDAIADAQKTVRDQISFNVYEIKKMDKSPQVQQMADNYCQSLQYEAALFDAAYMHNVGRGEYATIQQTMQEAETKSDEYYGLFMAELKTVNPALYDELVFIPLQAKSEVV